MKDEHSVTHWIHEIKMGDSAAANALWEHYFEKLVGLARRKLGGRPRRMADEEDVALSAFDSFCRAAEKGRFPNLADRDGLWRLLIQMTARKAVDLIRHNCRSEFDVVISSIADSARHEYRYGALPIRLQARRMSEGRSPTTASFSKREDDDSQQERKAG